MDLDLTSVPVLSGFEILKKWCMWQASPTVVDDEPSFDVNATTFSMLVSYTEGGESICQKQVNANRTVLGDVEDLQATWNQKMETVEALTIEQIAAMPKVMALIVEAAPRKL